MTKEEKAQEFARNCAEYNNLPIEVEHLLHTAFIVGYNERDDEEKKPWHKASEELPKEGLHILMAHKMKNGDYMTEAIWYPEPSITDNMEYWMEIPEIEK